MPASGVRERLISLGPDTIPIPERLLLAHARGAVLFITGAGISRAAGLPDFRGLVLEIYEQLDVPVHGIISAVPRDASNQWVADVSTLNHQQAAEVRRFIAGDYDVVLGMLERRLDSQTGQATRVRQAVANRLRGPDIKPTAIHRAIMRLANRGGALTVVTTNFDLLLEEAASKLQTAVQTYALGGIPRAGRTMTFSGILHIHGALDRNAERTSDLILSDQDFGEFYMRRRAVPDFIYDAARLFNLVLIGYSANDAPMRYLLNAVAADGSRFDDLKERFTFVGNESFDPVALEDWRGRGITPIHYDTTNEHALLVATLERWATFSAINGNQRLVDTALRRIVRTRRETSPDSERDLFDHLIRRSDTNELVRLAALASDCRADLGWLNAIESIAREPDRERLR